MRRLVSTRSKTPCSNVQSSTGDRDWEGNGTIIIVLCGDLGRLMCFVFRALGVATQCCNIVLSNVLNLLNRSFMDVGILVVVCLHTLLTLNYCVGLGHG